MYHEYPPDIRLQSLVETYWLADDFIAVEQRQLILPDGCVDIIFNFNNPHRAEQIALIGTMTSPLEISYRPGQVQMLGIRFAPAGITALTRLPVHEITNRRIELSLAGILFDTAFIEHLQETESVQLKLKYLNAYLVSRLAKFYTPDRQIQAAVSLIKDNTAGLSIKQLASVCCLGERQLERRFSAAIGISPKQFSSVMRFEYARSYLKAHPSESLQEVAWQCGYYDHSHLFKEFQHLGKIYPSELRNKAKDATADDNSHKNETF